MVLCMHYCGVAVLEAHASHDVRRAAAEGSHLEHARVQREPDRAATLRRRRVPPLLKTARSS
jgi:hypothetical protein